MTSQVNSSTHDFLKSINERPLYYKITIDYLTQDKLLEFTKLLDEYYKSKNWKDRIYPNHINIEKHQGDELRKCGRDECMNLILSGTSFCSQYCLDNYVSYDEDEMK